MTVEVVGCNPCGERRRDIGRLLAKARHEEWAGRVALDVRGRVQQLRQEIAGCSAAGHLVTAPLRHSHSTP